MKKRLLLISILVFVGKGISFSQAPNWAWAHSTGETADDVGNSVATDASGNVFMTGYFNSHTITFGTTTLTNADTAGYSSDVFLVKYDATGNVLWAKSAGSAFSDRAFSVSTDAGGNVFMTGYFSKSIIFGTDTLINANNIAATHDIFIVKYDASGNELWARSAGGLSQDYGVSVSTDAGGNVFMAGAFESPAITFGTTILTTGGFYTIFIVKYDSSGNALWAKSAGGTGITSDGANCVSTDANGNVFMTGSFGSSTITFGTITLTNGGGGTRIFIVKYDSSGSVLWAKGAGGTWGDTGRSISTDAGGNVFMTGGFYGTSIGFGGIILTSAGGASNFIVKYDSSGSALWAKAPTGTGSEIGFGVSTDASGNVFMTGVFGGSSIVFGTDTLTNAGLNYEDIFIVKYDSSGNVLWAKSAGGTNTDYGNSVSTDASGNVFLTGYFASPAITFGTTALTNSSGSFDVFIAKLGTMTGIEEHNNFLNEINIFPNPATGEFTIYGLQAPAELIMYNIYGREVYHKTVTRKQETCKLVNLPAGIYFVKVFYEEKYYCRKIIIEQD
ncbi:MAG TPA: T9SS type A sorting domain-containing protein [Bacteroidia bacterium]|nr:T9SS type A sorting domain-containing protein [Bacteroidia bacterium]